MDKETFGAHWNLYPSNRALIMKRANLSPEETSENWERVWQSIDAETQDRLFATCPTPEFSKRELALIDLLWHCMKRDPEHKDRVMTGYGTKTKTGLVACIDRIYKGE